MDRREICQACTERPARCWKNQDFACEHCFRNAEAKAMLSGFCPLNRWHAPWLADAAACPTCILSREQRAESREPIERFAELLRRDFTPPPGLTGDGIVTVAEGRYWPMAVLQVHMLRRTGCTLPVQIWHRGPVGRELDGMGVTLVDAAAVEALHPARRCSHFQAKSYAIAHCGWRRVLFLDADAYCVSDPAPLFALLSAHPFVYFDSGPWSYPKTNLALFGPLVESWAPPIQGGHYLVDCARYWKELQIARWMDDHAEAWHNANWDEDSWRCTISALGSDYLCLPASYCAGGMLCALDGRAMIVHRIHAKLFADRPPRRCRFPREGEVLRLFEELCHPPRDPEQERRRRLRAQRQKVLGSKH